MKLFTCCWSRQRDASPALPSVPGEVLRDILLPLDRWILDVVQFTCRRFLRLITERMSDVCLRQIGYATDEYCYNSPYGGSFVIETFVLNGMRRIPKAHVDIARLFSEFVQPLRRSYVHTLRLNGVVFTPELAELVLQAPIVAEWLCLEERGCGELTSAQFRDLLLHFSPTDLVLDRCHPRACQITDDFLRALSKKRVMRSSFPRIGPMDGGSFSVTDDAIVEFCAQQDVQIHSKREQLEELTLYHGSFTKDLFKRLVEASSVSVRTRPLRITVSPVCFEEEDLRDYAQYLTYRDRGRPWQQRIYSFPCTQRGAVTSTRLQLVLERETLILSRARQGSLRFY